MADYSKSIIYTIRTRDSVYVGSTICFRSRKCDHKGYIYNENSPKYNRKLYKTIRENDGEWDMQPYSKYPCNSKLELTIEEERVRQVLKADMNNNACWTGLTEKEYGKYYRDQHKGENKEYMKQYVEQNKNKINEQRSQKVTCECGCVVAKWSLSKHLKSKKHLKLIQSLEV